jgi:predicted DCC family thiol-disulfide oxidoreductase YuxK
VDGECALCAASVRFLNNGIKKNFFVTIHHIQSTKNSLPESVKNLSSVGLFSQEKWYCEWTAVQLCLKLKPNLAYHFVYWISRCIPTALGNAIYRFIAKRRLTLSKHYGSDICLLPNSFYPENKNSRMQLSPEIKAKKKG